MRRELTGETLRALMSELARTAPRRRSFRVYLVGGGTAVLAGWRSATIDADLCADSDDVFRDIQGIKERLRLNIEFARPEDFVPALTAAQRGTDSSRAWGTSTSITTTRTHSSCRSW